MEWHHLNSIFLVLTFLGILLFNRNELNELKRFNFFLGFSLIIEFVSIYTATNGWNNYWLFTLFLCVELIYFNSYHWKLLKSTKDIRIANYILFFSLTSSLVLVYITGYIRYWFFTLFIIYFIAHNLLILVALFREKTNQLLEQGQFWMANGRLTYYMLILFIFFGANLYEGINDNTLFQATFLIVNIVANFVRYSSYVKGFLLNE